MRVRMVPVLAVMTVVAGGCAGGGEPEVTAAPVPPATGTPSPTASAPAVVEVPNEATAATPEGAAAFIRFFFSQVELAYAQADPDLVAGLSAPDCMTCENYVSSLTALRDTGGSVSDYSIRVDSVEPSVMDSDDGVTAIVILDVGEYVRRDAEERVTTREQPATDVVQDVRLVLADSRWLVGEITQ